MAKLSGRLIPVCARCREAIGAGMQVTIWPAEMYADFLAATNGPALSDDDPIVTCIPCALQIKATLTESRVQ